MNKYIIILIFFGILSISSQNKTGAKLLISEDIINEGINSFWPEVFQALVNMKIEDQSLQLDAGIMNINVFITDILFNLQEIPSENINIGFQDPNIISAQIQNVNCESHFHFKAKKGFLHESFDVSVYVSRLQLEFSASLGIEKAKKYEEKNLPKIKIEKLNIEFDLDFDIHSSILGTLVNMVKSWLKKKIYNKVISVVQSTVKDKLPKMISNSLNKLPLTQAIYKDLQLDYSLLESPKVKDKKMILNIKGGVVNPKVKETLNPPYELRELDEINPKKDYPIQLLVSEYVMDTALYTMSLSNVINQKVDHTMLKPDSPVQLNTTFLDSLIPGIKAKYGEKSVDIEISFTKPTDVNPIMNISDGKLNPHIALLMKFIVEGEKESCVDINASTSVLVSLALETEGKLNVNVEKADVSDVKIIKNIVNNEIKPIELKTILNFTINISIPVINNMVMKNMKIEIPSIQGVGFSKSELILREDKFIEIGIKPEFNVHKLLALLSEITEEEEDRTCFLMHKEKLERKLLYLQEEKDRKFLK